MNRSVVVVEDTIKAGVLYDKMHTAIADCHQVDDCKAIADKAAAVAAYHKQIKDDASFRRFIEIKLRAYRRIGELLSEVVDDCPTMSAYIRKIKAERPGLLGEINESTVRQALRVTQLPQAFFDENVTKYTSIDSLICAHENEQRQESLATPEGQARQRAIEDEVEEIRAGQRQREQARAEEAAKEAARAREEFRQISVLRDAQSAALDEVGITLGRIDRMKMHQIVFLLKKPIAEILRQAAFDRRTTQQAILRNGLLMWFIANGYDVTLADMAAE